MAYLLDVARTIKVVLLGNIWIRLGKSERSLCHSFALSRRDKNVIRLARSSQNTLRMSAVA